LGGGTCQTKPSGHRDEGNTSGQNEKMVILKKGSPRQWNKKNNATECEPFT